MSSNETEGAGCLIGLALISLALYGIYLLIVHVIIPLGIIAAQLGLIALTISIGIGIIVGGANAVFNYTVAFNKNIPTTYKPVFIAMNGGVWVSMLAILMMNQTFQNNAKAYASAWSSGRFTLWLPPGNESANAKTQQQSVVTTPPPTTAQSTPLPTPVSTFSETDIRTTVQNWQTIKRKAFLNSDTSELTSILADKALEETVGGVNWWRDQTSERYHDITLHSLKFLEIKSTSATTSIARVQIDETKNNTVQGSHRSSYIARYTLTHQSGVWHITQMQAE